MSSTGDLVTRRARQDIERRDQERRRLLAGRFAGGLNQGHEHFAVYANEIKRDFGHADGAYFIEALGPGWTSRLGEDAVILTRQISAEAALRQISRYLGHEA